MIFFALVVLFALDSILTYWGITHLAITERNPVVQRLIETIGLAQAMWAIFFYKMGLLSLTALWKDKARVLWCLLLVVYSFCFAAPWLSLWLR